jgi:putative membrane protein
MFCRRSTAVPGVDWQDDGMRILIKLVITAVAVWVATVIIPGIHLHTHSTAGKIETLVIVALIFGIINAVLKPIAKTLGCLAYAITFGLISIVVNGLLFWLTSYVAGKLSVPFHITGFGPAVLGALLVGVVGWLLSLIVDRKD